jgi:TatD DNase family protein
VSTPTGHPTRSRVNSEFGGRRDVSRPPLPEPLPVPVVDNHCHLDIEDGESWLDPSTALEMSSSVGVDRIVQIGCDLPGAQWAVQTAEQYEAIVAGVALHPNEAPRLAQAGDLDDGLREIERLARSGDRVRAVGETGLDYFRTAPEGRAAQRASFAAHIELANRLDKTLVVHDRDAHDDVLSMLDEHGLPARTVLHCFSGDADFARRCLDRGAYLSFAGTVTFKNADYLREALALAPLDRILVETDAPFLTPMPYRGRPNASYLIPLTVRAMAQVRNDDLDALCTAIAANTEAAFGGSWGRSRSADPNSGAANWR